MFSSPKSSPDRTSSCDRSVGAELDDHVITSQATDDYTMVRFSVRVKAKDLG